MQALPVHLTAYGGLEGEFVLKGRHDPTFPRHPCRGNGCKRGQNKLGNLSAVYDYCVIKGKGLYSGGTSFNKRYTLAAGGRLGLRKNPVGLTPLVGFFSATFCGCRSLLRKALIRNRKTSYTSARYAKGRLN